MGLNGNILQHEKLYPNGQLQECDMTNANILFSKLQNNQNHRNLDSRYTTVLQIMIIHCAGRQVFLLTYFLKYTAFAQMIMEIIGHPVLIQ